MRAPTSHLNLMNIKRPRHMVMENLGPVLELAQEYGGGKPVNGITILWQDD